MVDQDNEQEYLDEEFREQGPMKAVKEDLRAGKEKLKEAMSRSSSDASEQSGEAGSSGDASWADNPEQPTPMATSFDGGTAGEASAAAKLGDVPTREVGEAEEPTPWSSSAGEEEAPASSPGSSR